MYKYKVMPNIKVCICNQSSLMKSTKYLLLLAALGLCKALVAGPVDYVSTLVGTMSKHSLSTGNTYPAIALPWGMNFWTP